MVRSPYFLPYLLLLLPLGACFPLLDGREPTDTVGGIGAHMSWAQGRRPYFAWGPSRWPRTPQAQALLVTAKKLQASGRRQAGFRLGRQDGSEGPGFLPADGKKAGGPLGNLAEELNGYSRKKGGFSFRFGRRSTRASSVSPSVFTARALRSRRTLWQESPAAAEPPFSPLSSPRPS